MGQLATSLTIPRFLEREIDKTINQCYQRVESFFSMEFRKPSISFLLSGDQAGNAVGRSHINLNGMMLINYETDFVKAIVPHEIAHLVDTSIHGKTSHGDMWGAIMDVLEADREPYHSFKPVTTKFVYTCLDCNTDVTLSKLRHKRACEGIQYACCHSPLVYNHDATIAQIV